MIERRIRSLPGDDRTRAAIGGEYGIGDNVEEPVLFAIRDQPWETLHDRLADIAGEPFEPTMVEMIATQFRGWIRP